MGNARALAVDDLAPAVDCTHPGSLSSRIAIVHNSHRDIARPASSGRTFVRHLSDLPHQDRPGTDVSFLCVVKIQRRWSNKIYKTELTKTRYNNQVLGKYRVDPQRAGLTLIVELTWSNLGLKGVLNKRK